jgi:ADP-ribose pyrophosphatase YjhB (NUDIX family)
MHFTPSFCPRCATPFAQADDHGTIRPVCPACGYVWYRNPVPAAGVILVESLRVLLVRRRWEPRAGAWCLPAGFMEAGEHPEQTAVRELQEETGVIAQLTGLFGVYAGFDDPRVRAVLILYTGVATGGEPRPGDDAEELEWFPLGALPEDLAFASHRQALAELRERLAGDASAPSGG